MRAVIQGAVEICDLVVRYGPATAVDRLSLTCPVGSVTAVLGPNGAGKTTTIETCEGYRKRASGTVRVLGLDPASRPRALRERVGVMLQSGGVPGPASAAQVLAYASGLYSNPLPVAALTDRLGLAGIARTPFRRLSGGEQQKVKLALALIGRPELVFLDEPTAGLDPASRLATLDLLRQLRADGVTIVLTSHLLHDAEQLADHVVVVVGGAVAGAGSPAALVAAHPVAQDAGPAIRFSAPPGLDLANLLAVLPPGTQAVEQAPGSYRIQGPAGRVEPGLVADVAGRLAAAAVPYQDFAVGQLPAPSLETVFLSLTGGAAR